MSVAETALHSEFTRRLLLATTRLILESLPPSSDPEVVFTALADALVSTGLADGVTVQLINHTALWRIDRPESYLSALSSSSSSSSLLTPLSLTQALFADGSGGNGNNEGIRTDDSIAIPIRALAVPTSVQLGPGPDFLGALICAYADRAPDSSDVEVLRILVVEAVGIVNQQRTEASLTDRAANLEVALASNREIGIALGVLCVRHQVSSEQAFEILKIASQNTNRKVRDLAAEVVASISAPGPAACVGHVDLGLPVEPVRTVERSYSAGPVGPNPEARLRLVTAMNRVHCAPDRNTRAR